MNDVGSQTGQKGLADPLGNIAPPLVAGVAFAHRAGGMPEHDIFRSQQSSETLANGIDGFGKEPVQGDQHFVLTPVAHNGLR